MEISHKAFEGDGNLTPTLAMEISYNAFEDSNRLIRKWSTLIHITQTLVFWIRMGINSNNNNHYLHIMIKSAI
jgi:hypothetical protein